MRPSLPPLPGLHAFEAAARTGSFAAAAGELYLSPAAISSRIRGLERHLGAALFERGARSIALTELGHAYLSEVRDAFDDLAISTAGLFGSAHTDQLTVRAQLSYATAWLAPRLRRFRSEHPHIGIRLASAIWADALSPDEVDVDIRHGSGSWPGASAELLHHDRAVVVRSVNHPVPADPHTGGATIDPEALAHRPRVQVTGFDDLWWRLDGTSHTRAPDITVDTAVAAIQVAATSDYLAVVPERFARTAVHSGQIALAIPTTLPMRQAHYVVRPHGAPDPGPDAKTFLRWLNHQENQDTPLGQDPSPPPAAEEGTV